MKDKNFAKSVGKKVAISKAKNYQKALNENKNDLNGVVYILHFAHLNGVKIGFSTNIKERFKDFRKNFGPFEIVDLIETDCARTLESDLHKLYDHQRFCVEQRGSGRTEFFLDEILIKAYDEI